jgi:hypothetical protein
MSQENLEILREGFEPFNAFMRGELSTEAYVESSQAVARSAVRRRHPGSRFPPPTSPSWGATKAPRGS